MQSRIERHFSDHVVDSRSKDWLAVILGPAISVPFATCYAALICSDASLRNHFPMVLQYLSRDFGTVFEGKRFGKRRCFDNIALSSQLQVGQY